MGNVEKEEEEEKCSKQDKTVLNYIQQKKERKENGIQVLVFFGRLVVVTFSNIRSRRWDGLGWREN